MIQNSAYEIFMSRSDFKVLCKRELKPKDVVLLAKVRAATRAGRVYESRRVAAAHSTPAPLAADGGTLSSRHPDQLCPPPLCPVRWRSASVRSTACISSWTTCPPPPR